MSKIYVLFILLTITHVYGLRHNNRYKESELEEILNELKATSENDNSFIRNKKNKNDDDENSAIASHRKKNGNNLNEDQQEDKEKSTARTTKTCLSQFKFESNYIIDSKKSIQQGATLIRVEYLTKEIAMLGLNGLQESCMKQCCDTESCDSALVSMRLGPVHIYK